MGVAGLEEVMFGWRDSDTETPPIHEHPSRGYGTAGKSGNWWGLRGVQKGGAESQT